MTKSIKIPFIVVGLILSGVLVYTPCISKTLVEKEKTKQLELNTNREIELAKIWSLANVDMTRRLSRISDDTNDHFK